jgi:hypothetical protein
VVVSDMFMRREDIITTEAVDVVTTDIHYGTFLPGKRLFGRWRII